MLLLSEFLTFLEPDGFLTQKVDPNIYDSHVCTVYLFQLIMNMDTLLCFPDFSYPSSFSARIVECIIFPHTACHSGDALVQPAYSSSVSSPFISACVL